MRDEVAPVGNMQTEGTLAQNKLPDFRMDEYDLAEQGSTFSTRGNVFTNRSTNFSGIAATVNRGTRFSSRIHSTQSDNG
jgi:hypothetical protein